MLRLLRETLSTCSTPGVALTYFSMRQVSVFSTSLGPRPGAIVPTTRTGGVSSGNVSTLMRGVTTTAKTTSAIAAIRMAMGFRRDRPVMSGPPSGSSATKRSSCLSRDVRSPWISASPASRCRHDGHLSGGELGRLLGVDAVAILEDRPPLRHHRAPGSKGPVDEERTTRLAQDRHGLRVSDLVRDEEHIGLAAPNGRCIERDLRRRNGSSDIDVHLTRRTNGDRAGRVGNVDL